MSDKVIDIMLFGVLISVFSIISISVAIFIGLINGVGMGIVTGIGVLIVFGARQLMKETTLQSHESEMKK